MTNRVGTKVKLTSVDELLCVPETQGTTDIAVDKIYSFENHPFKVLFHCVYVGFRGLFAVAF